MTTSERSSANCNSIPSSETLRSPKYRLNIRCEIGLKSTPSLADIPWNTKYQIKYCCVNPRQLAKQTSLLRRFHFLGKCTSKNVCKKHFGRIYAGRSASRFRERPVRRSFPTSGKRGSSMIASKLLMVYTYKAIPLFILTILLSLSSFSPRRISMLTASACITIESLFIIRLEIDIEFTYKIVQRA